MKRGFLNSAKAKQKIEQAQKAESNATAGPSKKVVQTEMDTPASSIAQGRHYSSLNLHKLPDMVLDQIKESGGTETRKIFRVWPRDPKGKPLLPSEIHGKEAGGGIQLWGATLYDFYHVRRLPDVPNLRTTSTGSKLAASMRAMGELKAADEEIEWADMEEDPKEIPPADIGEMIRKYEERVRSELFYPFSMRPEISSRYSVESEPNVNDTKDESKKSDEADKPNVTSDDEMEVEQDGEADGHEDSEEQADSIINDSIRKNNPALNNDNRGASTIGEHNEDIAAMSGPDSDADMVVEETPAKEEEANTGLNTDDQPPLDVPLTSPFHPSHYPSPWPITPCVYPHLLPRLQKRIPHHLLPKKLYVHDPWNLLSVENGDVSNLADDEDYADPDFKTPWNKKKDIVRLYHLALNEQAQKEADKAELAERLSERERVAKDGEVMKFLPAGIESGPVEWPMVEAVLPPHPPNMTTVPEAHLYISPRNALGNGNHSVVYRADWEIPRDLLVPSELCDTCIREKAEEELGKWKDMRDKEELNTGDENNDAKGQGAVKGKRKPVGEFTVEQIFEPGITASWLTEEERRQEDKDIHEKSNETPKPTNDNPTETKGDAANGAQETQTDGTSPMAIDTNEDGVITAKAKGKQKEVVDAPIISAENKGENKAEEILDKPIIELQTPNFRSIRKYSGEVLQFTPDVQWQNPSQTLPCQHLARGHPAMVPQTARVEVVAKLSIAHDSHISVEAENYQKFPPHFFENWNGYNVVPPLHDPVPVGAIVPQFYGYYLPEKPVVKEHNRPNDLSYLSPILLLEHCGTPIEPDRLSQDDKQECASLLFRFHCECWTHESFAARNIVKQKGRPTESQEERATSEHRSFRLIDFGRSRNKRDGHSRAYEENKALELFKLHHFAFL